MTLCHAAAEIAVARLLPLFEGDAPITRRDLNAILNEASGATDADGGWTQRESFELLEHALVRRLAPDAMRFLDTPLSNREAGGLPDGDDDGLSDDANASVDASATESAQPEPRIEAPLAA